MSWNQGPEDCPVQPQLPMNIQATSFLCYLMFTNGHENAVDANFEVTQKLHRSLKAQYGTYLGWNPLFIPVHTNYVIPTRSLHTRDNSLAECKSDQRITLLGSCIASSQIQRVA